MNDSLPLAASVEEYDRMHREAGLRAMAPVCIRYDDPQCPHEGCRHSMRWIAFRFEEYRDRSGSVEPLIRSWWEGTGFAGRCPACGGWIRFTTLGMEALDAAAVARLPRLPDDWDAVARIA